MYFIFSITILIAAIIFTAIRYFLAYARLTSHKSFEKEAKLRTARLSYEDPVITCDYCGSKINTVSDRGCPSCGATYFRDKEWILRHQTDAKWVDANAEETADAEISRSYADARKQWKLLRMLLIIFSAALAAHIIIFVSLTALNTELFMPKAKS